jgi:putative transposase
MCQIFQVSRDGFYKWLKRPESSRAVKRRQFDVLVKASFERNRKRAGSQKLCEELSSQGTSCSRSKVARSMKRQNLRCIVRKKFVPTTNSKHTEPIAPNLLNRQFHVERKNQVLVSDITYIPSRVGWLYLTVIIDLFSRMVVGWNLSNSLGHEGALSALHQAVWRRKLPRGAMFHSDRGVQYACRFFREALAGYGLIQSMSRKGNCWDNAVAESFFRTLKTELIYHVDLLSEDHARKELFEYIEIYYNRQRLHATLDYVSPADFESMQLRKCA